MCFDKNKIKGKTNKKKDLWIYLIAHNLLMN